MNVQLPERAQRLRALHPIFRYDHVSVTPAPEGLRIDYRFSLPPTFTFTPHWIIPLRKPAIAEQLCNDPVVQRLGFLIGMAELLSYWKTTCSPSIEVGAGPLELSDLEFWSSLIRNGLGEFFYLNKISPTLDFEIIATSLSPSFIPESTPPSPINPDSYLVLVGGGKDSSVTLELLKQLHSVEADSLAAFAVNPISASVKAIKTAGYTTPLLAHRTIDPALRNANSQGYLNGHTPFSALIAFASTLTAYTNGFKYVVASNESSANEGNTVYDGYEINHQYSKSFQFEGAFRDYINRLEVPNTYFSFLRPLNELQICGLFSRLTAHHNIFRSCNREQTLTARSRSLSTDPSTSAPYKQGWCAQCPKCIFTFLCLHCFLPREELESIFGVDPSTMPHFESLVYELAGLSSHKPFECVGTYQEVRVCIAHLYKRKDCSPSLARICGDIQQQDACARTPSLVTLLAEWHDNHFLSIPQTSLLRSALEKLKTDTLLS